MNDPSTQSILRRCAARARSAGQQSLSEADGKAVLAAAGIAVPKGMVIEDVAALGSACAALTFPVAIKGVSPQLVHKSDAGAVRLGCRNLEDARTACAEISDSVGEISLEGFLIEEMAPAGHEVIVGGVIDPQFGPAIMVGLGGVFVEVLADVAFRICPISRADAIDMLQQLAALPVLDGARCGITASRDAIVDTLVRIGGEQGILVREQQDIAELDINPLIVSDHGAVAADVRIVPTEFPRDDAESPPRAETAESVRARFQPLFEPRNIAVVGASATRRTRSNTVIDQILRYGFDREKLYPIHPTAAEIDGLRAYPSLRATPEPVDYAYVAIPAAGVPDLLSNAKGRLEFAHVTSSGFAEFGRDDLQDTLVAAAR
ncbi:MAG: acetate--CoA ligase family protein, partial [Pseudomonadota bacterium]